MSVNDRVEAFHVLIKVCVQHQPLAQAVTSRSLSSFARELCFGVCRQYYRLEAILNQLLDKKTKNPSLRIALLLGLYQLQYSRKAEYAVVKESVAMLDSLRLGWAKGLMNAVLRGFTRSREQIFKALQDNMQFLYGHPQWMLARWQQDWPEQWEAIARANDAHPPMSLRVNLRKISREDYLKRLEKAEMIAKAHPDTASAVILATPCPVEQLPGFQEGMVSVQDVAAQFAAALLKINAEIRVLDACCAPGGKTCHILEQDPSPAECLAIDVDPRRMQKVRANLERLNLHTHLQVADALHPEKWWDGHYFDCILLDAPCSASGIIRRQPDIRVLRTAQEVGNAVALQKQLLYALWPLLKPEGQLLYATCSIFKEENEQQILNFLDHHRDARSDTLNLASGYPCAAGWQFLPGESQMDGFFYASLVKNKH